MQRLTHIHSITTPFQLKLTNSWIKTTRKEEIDKTLLKNTWQVIACFLPISRLLFLCNVFFKALYIAFACRLQGLNLGLLSHNVEGFMEVKLYIERNDKNKEICGYVVFLGVLQFPPTRQRLVGSLISSCLPWP